MIIIKNQEQIALMRSAGHLLYDVLQYLASQVKPGITTEDINRMADEMIRKNGAIPTELGYAGYPKSICVSVDDEVVHGIPSPNVRLEEGQIVSMDLTLSLNGWQSDSCLTVPVGEISRQKKDLIRVTEECFWLGYRQALNGNRIGDISAAVQKHAESNGCGVVRELTGHGIGREMHEDPSVPNFGLPGHGPRLRPGMTICVEPMITAGNYRVHELADGWTVVTNDHQPASHYEHTILIKKEGEPEILTLPDGGKGRQLL